MFSLEQAQILLNIVMEHRASVTIGELKKGTQLSPALADVIEKLETIIKENTMEDIVESTGATEEVAEAPAEAVEAEVVA